MSELYESLSMFHNDADHDGGEFEFIEGEEEEIGGEVYDRITFIGESAIAELCYLIGSTEEANDFEKYIFELSQDVLRRVQELTIACGFASDIDTLRNIIDFCDGTHTPEEAMESPYLLEEFARYRSEEGMDDNGEDERLGWDDLDGQTDFD